MDKIIRHRITPSGYYWESQRRVTNFVLDAGIDVLADDESIVFHYLGMDSMKEIDRDPRRNTFGLEIPNDVYDASVIGSGDLGDRDTTFVEMRDESAFAAAGGQCKHWNRTTSLAKMIICNCPNVIDKKTIIAYFVRIINFYL